MGAQPLKTIGKCNNVNVVSLWQHEVTQFKCTKNFRMDTLVSFRLVKIDYGGKCSKQTL